MAVLVPLSALVSRNKWDVHNSVLGVSELRAVCPIRTNAVRLVNVIHHGGRRDASCQSLSVTYQYE